MTERNEQGFVKDINLAIEAISQNYQNSKDKVRALISLPFDFNDVPQINNFINGETTQAVECIDELNNIAILNEQVLEFDETLKSKFEERHNELVEALMNRLEGVFKMYNNENLNQNVQPTYPAVGQPVEVQTPQVEEFNPVTPVESYAAPAVEAAAPNFAAPEAFAEPAVQEPVVEVPPMEIPAVEIPAVETPVMEAPTIPEPVLETQEVSEPVAEVPAMEIPNVELPQVEAPAMEEPVVELPQAEEGFVGPELTEELFNNEAISLAGIIVPTEEEKLPEEADLNNSEEPEEVPEAVEENDEQDEVVKEIEERYNRLKDLEINVYNNEKKLDDLRSEVDRVQDQITADKEEIASLQKVA